MIMIYFIDDCCIFVLIGVSWGIGYVIVKWFFVENWWVIICFC